jgi:hypothetical protein
LLQEITNLRQIEGDPRRRWFADAVLDLYVWYDDEDNVIQFQICYDKGPGEQALTWKKEQGFIHHAVDDGEGGIYRMKSTPVILEKTRYDGGRIPDLIKQHGGKLEHDLYEFILSRLTG